jgi:hypothetical protein
MDPNGLLFFIEEIEGVSHLCLILFFLARIMALFLSPRLHSECEESESE